MLYDVVGGDSMNVNISADYIRGHIDTIILKLLSKSDMYGYQISKEIYRLSDKTYQLKEASLYSSVKRLENDLAIKSYWGEESQGGRRKYYQITDVGLKMLSENLKSWQQTKQLLNTLLEDE